MVEQDTTPDAPTRTPGMAKGEEQIENQGKEPGRIDTGTNVKVARPPLLRREIPAASMSKKESR